MKKIAFFLIFIFFVFTCSQCRKGSSPKPVKTDSSYVILHDKPLSVIQSYIKGNWQLLYEQGSNLAGIFPQTDFFWEFDLSNHVAITYHGSITTDTLINWVKAESIFSDSTFVMTFNDKQGVPWAYIIDGIYNDTLVLYDNASDYITYHFTKKN